MNAKNQHFQYRDQFPDNEKIIQFKHEGKRHLLLMKEVSSSVAQLTGVDEKAKTQKALTDDYKMTVWDVVLDEDGGPKVIDDPVPLSIGSFFLVRINDYKLYYKGKEVLRIEDTKTQVIKRIKHN